MKIVAWELVVLLGNLKMIVLAQEQILKFTIPTPFCFICRISETVFRGKKKEDLFWPWWTAWTFNLKIVWLLPPQYISNRCIWCVCVVFIVFSGRFSGSSRGSPARTLDQGQGRLQHQAGGNYYSNVIQTWPCLWGYTYRYQQYAKYALPGSGIRYRTLLRLKCNSLYSDLFRTSA